MPRATSIADRNKAAHIALLRGINVGGRNKLPMINLKAMFTKAGAEAVHTYIQSGNVVFLASAADAKHICGTVSGMIGKKFGFQPVIVLRSRPELDSIINARPFVPRSVEDKAIHIGFTADAPGKALIASLDPNRSPGDRFVVIAKHGGAIYLKLATGAADTKLTNAWFDKSLQTSSTFRNWRTTLKLLELATAIETDG